MSEANKALVRQALIDLWQDGNVNRIDEFCTPDFMNHTVAADRVQGIETEKRSILRFLAAFSNYQVLIEELLATDDRVILRGSWRGTHTGYFKDIAPTGKVVVVDEIAIFRLVDGKIAELWASTDLLGLYRQLGVTMI